MLDKIHCILMFLDKLDEDFENESYDQDQTQTLETEENFIQSKMIKKSNDFTQKPRIFAIIYDSLSSLIAFIMKYHLRHLKEFCMQLKQDNTMTFDVDPLIEIIYNLKTENQLIFGND